MEVTALHLCLAQVVVEVLLLLVETQLHLEETVEQEPLLLYQDHQLPMPVVVGAENTLLEPAGRVALEAVEQVVHPEIQEH